MNAFLKTSFFNTTAWPFEEARKLLDRTSAIPDKTVIFETGYGPSGLPHIGTFGEVARTSMVLHAFNKISDRKAKLICFSDDLDGLRKVPDNVPNQKMLSKYLELPLTRVPDPFDKYESFGHHNNAMLREFLDRFGFEYEFISSSEYYKAGLFDKTLLLVLKYHKEILDVMLPTLGDERRGTYSPFLPISPSTGKVLQVPMEEYREETLIFRDEDGKFCEIPVTGGSCKLQWKVDWGMRWAALGVDYEMYGKDLIDSAILSSKICRILGGNPPDGFSYEHFLDEKGGKISKSKGNGISVEQWLSYAPKESLSYFMYNHPRRAKRLYFDIIPKCVDDYLSSLDKFKSQDEDAILLNPAWHIHNGNLPDLDVPISFGLLLNLASVCNAEDNEVLWGYIERYSPGATPSKMPFLDELTKHAVRYYNDFVKPNKVYRAPTEMEKVALCDLLSGLDNVEDTIDAIQFQLFEIAKRHPFESMKDWFSCLYEVLLGQKEGPRMGSFISIYGIDETKKLIRALID